MRPATLGLLGGVLLVIAWSLIEARTLTVTKSVVTSPDLPPEFEGARLAYVADVHAGPYFSRKRVAALVATVNAQRPDIVVLGGDYVGGRKSGDRKFYPEIAKFRAPLGVYAVLGNHDSWEGADKARQELAESGAVLLENDNVRVEKDGASICLAGVADLMTGSPDVSGAAEDVRPGEFAVIISHNVDVLPTTLPDYRRSFDLALTGHTHAGQLTFFGLWAPIVPSRYGNRYRSGWFDIAGVPVLVSRGVGTVTLPVRFFAPPQVHVIELKRGPASARDVS